MAEKIVIHQNNKFETMYMVWDTESPAGTVLRTVDQLQAYTPYGLMLASLGACTAMVMNTFARDQKINLDEVEVTLVYNRDFDKDCEDCDQTTDYNDVIQQNIILHGNISNQDRERLASAGEHCSIYQMLSKGIKISSQTDSVVQMREEEINRK